MRVSIPYIEQKASEIILEAANNIVKNFPYDEVFPEKWMNQTWRKVNSVRSFILYKNIVKQSIVFVQINVLLIKSID